MGDNKNEFFKQLDKMEDEIIEGINDAVKEVIFEITSALLDPKAMGGTPVITGWLRNSWFISSGSPSATLSGSKKSPGAALGKQNSSFDAFINSDVTKYKDIYINNNVPYGPEVNYGSAKSAPQHFREKSIQRAEIKLRSAKVIK